MGHCLGDLLDRRAADVCVDRGAPCGSDLLRMLHSQKEKEQ